VGGDGKMHIYTRTVVAIPAAYKEDQSLDLESTKKYVEYLDSQNVGTVMTTAGTSHFNLLSIDEVHRLNESVVKSFSGQKIIGVPALSLCMAKEFVKTAHNYLDEKSNLMFLYPDRYYTDELIESYMESVGLECKNSIYIHGKTVRNAVGGSWDYNSEVINNLFYKGILRGIKEEHSQLNKSYDFVSDVNKDIDVIVAGGSMRRFEFLRSAGANSFLSGVGNLFPKIEQQYLDGDKEGPLEIEKKMFKVFMKYGWHKSLRIALDYLDLTCYNNREPWPATVLKERLDIANIIEEIKYEK
jgi:dihydrodipicolinate synthase/N-acetylneuraminate lyase